MAHHAFPPNASLEELIALARKKFEIAFKPVHIGDQTLELAHITNMPEHLDRLTQTARNGRNIQLPLWAKIWPAATLLACSIRQVPCTGKESVLEIGAGQGIPALFAAARGFTTVISDINEDALLFAQINILKNGLSDKARVERIDFSTTPANQKYDIILGSEVFYIPKAAKPLVHFIKDSLKPQGMTLLARDLNRQENEFLNMASSFFAIGTKTIGYREHAPNTPDQKKQMGILYRLTPKPQAS